MCFASFSTNLEKLQPSSALETILRLGTFYSWKFNYVDKQPSIKYNTTNKQKIKIENTEIFNDFKTCVKYSDYYEPNQYDLC